jgi:hypothetical protein
MEGWKMPHNEKFQNLYSSPNIADDQMKEDTMGSICRIHGKVEKSAENFNKKA